MRSLCLLFPFVALAAAAAPPVRDGLVFSFDAAAQVELRRTGALPPLAHRQPADGWLDAAGLAAQQPVLAQRPVFYTDGTAAFFRFDGKDDAFTLAGPRRLAPVVTVFALAAPKGNAGGFAGLYATSESGKNDYTSGLNLDQGPKATPDLNVLNVETAGAQGMRDLLEENKFGAAARPFGAFHVFTVRTRVAKNGTELFLDGVKAGTRDRMESMIGLDQLTLGARRFSNDRAQLPHVQGHFAGDLAALLIYDRALDDAERLRVEEWLAQRTPALHALSSGAQGHALEIVANPPPVQVLVPGFTVQELPLKIGNLNNVRYRRDGKVVAQGYDGRIYLLSDTDGDGLEDKADFFWPEKTMRGPMGIALTTDGGDGVLVGSKGKVSLFLDANGDGRADSERVVATGWKEGFQGVDTVGLAVDPKDGSIYFGLGCANFADGYLIDKATGQSKYDINSHHGTIQRMSADFSKREAIATGVRFTCALAFNRHGDLFASEQEGATWLPNGNPFDELLHIQPGKHYGFPPRHPKHLPGVVDEPPVFDYGPQHQSTVGMVFNEGVNGGPHFGPVQWAGDAILCGEARGKIYRTKLVKTAQGYVAQNHLFACVTLLTVDACVTPQGDLLVACHSGPPDWGTGPAGEGRLFKIRYTGKTVPQPVLAWAAAADEFRVAFDRPLDPAAWAKAKDAVKIEAGAFVSAGDRFEAMRPGYQVVRDQMGAPRRWVEVLGVSLSADQRTLVLRVPRQTEPTGYAITLPLPADWPQRGGLAQHPQIDLALTLNGVLANVQEESCVLPHPSVAVSRELTAGSAEHAVFFAKATSFPIRALVDTTNPFVPAVQPGSKLDYDPTKDAFSTATFAVRGEKDVPLGDAPGRLKPLAATTGDLFFARENLRTTLSPTRVFVPWASEAKADDKAMVKTRDDVKGRWLHGRRLYFGEAACHTCHSIRGEGSAFGPELTNLIHRDRASVLHDILQPSATINPDQAGSAVKLKDGSKLEGIVKTATDAALTLALPGGAQMEIARDKVASLDPLKASLMLGDYAQRLSKEQQEDLLTFLLTNPLEPTPLTRLDPAPPAPRPRAEVAALLSVPQPRADAKPLRLLLCGDAKDHGIDEHDYPLWLARWSKLLALADGVTVTTCATGFPTAAQLAAADVTIFYANNSGWNADAAKLLDEYQQRGGGLVYLHWGIEGRKHAPDFAERAGLAFSMSAFRHGPMKLAFTDPAHPITRGFEQIDFLDESYWRLHGDPKRLAVLATSLEDNAPQPQLWTLERGKGRVFGCIPGHYMWTHDDPLYRLLVLRGIAWAARDPDVDRLAELALIGARLAP